MMETFEIFMYNILLVVLVQKVRLVISICRYII